MGHSWKVFGYIMAANFQAATIVFVIIKGGEYLNERYPMQSSWQLILSPLAVITIAYMYYKVLVAIARIEKQKRKKRG